jgi:hypothetical protein
MNVSESGERHAARAGMLAPDHQETLNGLDPQRSPD